MFTTRQVERAIIKRVIGELLDIYNSKRFSIGVYDGWDITLHHSRDVDVILSKMFTTDSDKLLLNVDNKFTVGYVELVYGNGDGYEVINDWHGSTEWLPVIDIIMTGIVESLDNTLVTE